jgi:hypothetical protein
MYAQNVFNAAPFQQWLGAAGENNEHETVAVAAEAETDDEYRALRILVVLQFVALCLT